MITLKDESMSKCFSVIREFIEELGNEKKGTAMLALEQLRRITAGTDLPGLPDTDPGTGSASGDKCLTVPRGDEPPGDPIDPSGI